jgi:N,N'-diacetyllegionaminate synthase
MLKNIFHSTTKAIYIAEIGLNHNGDIDIAKKMIKAAAKSGAHKVKFQTFIPEKMNSVYTKSLINTGIEENPDSSLIDFFKQFILTKEEYLSLKNYAREKNVIFFSSPFDFESVDLLEDIGVPLYKIASSELTNIPLLGKIASTKKPVILSTGMSKKDEIEMAIKSLKSIHNIEIVLMHCVSLYPLPHEEINIKRIVELKKTFNLPVGFSDHSKGYDADILAAAVGARIFEKHFTIDNKYDCPDKDLSLTPDQFSEMIENVEKTIEMLGSGNIEYNKNEAITAKGAKRSIFALKFIPKGKIIEEKDLVLLRPGTGIPPMEIHSIIGKEATLNIKENFLIRNEYLK